VRRRTRTGVVDFGRNGTPRRPFRIGRRRVAAGTLIVSMAELKPEQIIALVAPIVVIQLGLMIAALYDLEKDDRRVRGDSKLVWALVIVFVNVLGPIIYLVAGREES
jgi:hypothetical protein